MAIASDVLTRVRDVLQDKAERRWQDSELCRWIEDAQRLIVQLKPETNSGFRDVNLVQGAKQALPNDFLALEDVVANGTESTPGSGIREASKYWFDRSDPTWQFGTQTDLVDQFIRDKDKNFFYVYPPNTGNGTVIMKGGIAPQSVEDSGSTLDLGDTFIKGITDYVCAKALYKDAGNPVNKQLADGYIAAFYAALGMAVETEDGS